MKPRMGGSRRICIGGLILLLSACGCVGQWPATVNLTLVDATTNQPLRNMSLHLGRANDRQWMHVPAETDSVGAINGLSLQPTSGTAVTLKPPGYHTSSLLVDKGLLYIFTPMPDSVDLSADEVRDISNGRLPPFVRSRPLSDTIDITLAMTPYPKVDAATELTRFCRKWGCPTADEVRKISASDFVGFQFFFREDARTHHMIASDEERVLELYQTVREEPERAASTQPATPSRLEVDTH